MSTITVMRGNAHGIPAQDHADILRGRLPDWEVRVARTPAEEREYVTDAEVVTGFGLGDELLERAEQLQLFACASAGTGHLNLDAFAEHGVTVTNASGVHGPPIAEQAIGYMLAIARDLPTGMRRQDRREWRHYKTFGEVKGSTVTVVGLGAIGQAVVERLAGFDVETIGVRYTPSKGGPTDEVIGFDHGDLHAVFARTDYLILATPLTDTTYQVVDADAFRTLPADAVLINVARGGLVETDALVRALRHNDIHAAALDVTDPEPLPENHPLWTLENVLITPHMSGYTPEYWDRTAAILIRNLERVEDTGEWTGLENQVA